MFYGSFRHIRCTAIEQFWYCIVRTGGFGVHISLFSFCAACYIVVVFDMFSKLILCVVKVFVGEWRVDASATLKIQMLSYANPSKRSYDGSCCDPFCWSACDHYFRFSLDVGNR